MRATHMSALACVLLGSCSSTGTEWAEPEPEELMGEGGWLEQAGANITMDLGPGQKTLLSEYSTLREEYIALKQSLSSMEAEREGLEASLEDLRNELKEERNLRAQADAESDSHRKSVRELEAKILSLSIKMAKLEQENLTLKIDKVTQNLESLRAAPTSEGATPPRIRR